MAGLVFTDTLVDERRPWVLKLESRKRGRAIKLASACSELRRYQCKGIGVDRLSEDELGRR